MSTRVPLTIMVPWVVCYHVSMIWNTLLMHLNFEFSSAWRFPDADKAIENIMVTCNNVTRKARKHILLQISDLMSFNWSLSICKWWNWSQEGTPESTKYAQLSGLTLVSIEKSAFNYTSTHRLLTHVRLHTLDTLILASKKSHIFEFIRYISSFYLSYFGFPPL